MRLFTHCLLHFSDNDREVFFTQRQYFTINFCVLDESINFGAFNFPLYKNK